METVIDTLEAADRYTAGKSDVTKGAAAIGASQVGALMAGARLISPYDLVQSLMRSDEEIDRRTNKIWNDGREP